MQVDKIIGCISGLGPVIVGVKKTFGRLLEKCLKWSLSHFRVEVRLIPVRLNN